MSMSTDKDVDLGLLFPLPQVVLVVEDHPLQRRVLVRMLESLGVTTVVEAEDGAQALALLAADAMIDMVFTDLDMPTMDGLALMRKISEHAPNVGVVVLSSVERELLAAVEWLAREQNIDLMGVIQKPATRQALEAVLHHPTRQVTESKQAEFSISDIAAGFAAGQFEAFVQPKLGFADGKLIGGEALARWRHPQRGIVMPAAFIPALEASPLIEPFSLAILKSASWAVRFLEASFLPGRIAINASPAWLDQPTMSERLIQAVRKLDIPVARLTIEVTETVANGNLAVALENLARLSMAGFTLSVDDFGTGFSSLKRLVSSPFRELKLDRSFVSQVEHGSVRWMVMQSTIALARNLGLETVAEGVETDSEWQLLKDAGCDACQGYFTAKPMSETVFMSWAQQNPAAFPDRREANWLTTDMGKLR